MICLNFQYQLDWIYERKYSNNLDKFNVLLFVRVDNLMKPEWKHQKMFIIEIIFEKEEYSKANGWSVVKELGKMKISFNNLIYFIIILIHLVFVLGDN